MLMMSEMYGLRIGFMLAIHCRRGPAKLERHNDEHENDQEAFHK